jgi:hypothetical protein
MSDWRARGALAGGVIGAVFHLAWHMRVTIPILSAVLWEWGGLFAEVARLELIGLHLGVLVAHVMAYVGSGTLLGLVLRH